MSTPTSFDAIRASLDGAAISTYILSMVMLPLKYWCRLQGGGKRNLGLDDALIGVAAILSNAFFYDTMIGVRPLLGRHADGLELPAIIEFLRFVFPAQLLYVLALTFIKLSLLTFYWRLFSVRSKKPILAGVALVIAWSLAVNLSLIFTCDPVEAQWDLTITNAKCLNTKKVYLGASIPNVVTDILLLVLPLPYVWGLHAPVTQRLILAGIFLLGVFVGVVSVVRLAILMGLNLTNGDVTFNLSQVFIWSLVEVQVGLVCGCLPSLRPAVQMLGLGRLIPSTRPTYPDSGPLDNNHGHVQPSAHSREKSKSGGGRKNFGLFSTLAGVSQIDEVEDSFEMIKKYNGGHGKTDTVVGAHAASTTSRSSTDTVEPNPYLPQGTLQPGGPGHRPIKVQRDWYVSVDHSGGGGA